MGGTEDCGLFGIELTVKGVHDVKLRIKSRIPLTVRVEHSTVAAGVV